MLLQGKDLFPGVDGGSGCESGEGGRAGRGPPGNYPPVSVIVYSPPVK